MSYPAREETLNQLSEYEYGRYIEYLKQDEEKYSLDYQEFQSSTAKTTFDKQYVNSRLYSDLPDMFWRFFFKNITREVVDENELTSTARIEYNPISKKMRMCMNKNFFEKVISNKKIQYWSSWVVQHEILHVVLNHATKEQPEGEVFRTLFNIAVDLSVNSIIYKGAPTLFFLPGLGAMKSFKTGLAYDTYYNQLFNLYNRDIAFKEYIDTMVPPQHDWNSFSLMNDVEKKETEILLKQMLMEVGLPQCFQKLDTAVALKDTFLQPKNIDVLVNTLNKQSQKYIEDSSYSIPNRRFRGFPGDLSIPEGKSLFVLVDSSGSIDDNKLQTFLSYIKYLNKFFKVTICAFAGTPQGDSMKTYEKHKFDNFERGITGDTSFLNAILFARSVAHRNDVIIMFTDLCDNTIKGRETELLAKNFYFVTGAHDYFTCVNEPYKKYCFVLDNKDKK
jgi:hypothetical protein